MPAAFMDHSELFAGLTPAQRAEVAASAHLRNFQRGAMIFSEGEPGEAAFFIQAGRVKVYRTTPDGQEQIVGLFDGGEPFGLVALLDDSPYPANAVAVTTCRIWVVRCQLLRSMLTENPSLTRSVMREVAERLRKAQSRVHALAAQTVHQRLAGYLLELVAKEGEVVQLPLTHQELGGYLGASRETVSRALADLKRDGAVEALPSGQLKIHREELERLL